jgi:hypothetical protein
VIQRRAEAIQEWPFQQRRLAQIAGIVGTVVTLVITGIITRLIPWSWSARSRHTAELVGLVVPPWPSLNPALGRLRRSWRTRICNPAPGQTPFAERGLAADTSSSRAT